MMGGAGLVFVGIYLFLIFVPCFVVGFLGYRFIENLGRYPSKTPVFQVKMLFWMVVTEIVSMSLLMAFFKILVAE